ncbi:HAD family hydrolase [Hyphomicrobium sp.]|uniref:HAD family hydrolase n=1 Tax=Hyphomicrobium sp. TaxID=82 RepID=UPI0025C29B9E|nr:HAD family hydrolase [Hyphomicrobium sp.]MCC7253354.1 haloacid dehalogenase-like hydrolase [Hyphomicrobium sp.]
MTERATGQSKDADDEMPVRERASPTGSKRKTIPAEAFDKKTIALVYDFDGTLSPRPMQEYSFLPQLGVEPAAFWAECTRVAREQQADPLITYMHLMYKMAREKGLRIDRDDLVKQGASVELFPGVAEWFAAIADYIQIRAESAGVALRHYLVSSGLTEIIEGTTIREHFHNVFASEYWFDAYELPFPKRVITDTGKTQYLFRINKGIEDLGESINAHMAEELRPIPFRNMIYFGDGETDVPSMALMRKSGGHAVAVHPEERGKGYATCVELFRAGRVDFFAAADYRRGSDLFKRTCLLLDRILADIAVQEEIWKVGKGMG